MCTCLTCWTGEVKEVYRACLAAWVTWAHVAWLFAGSCLICRNRGAVLGDLFACDSEVPPFFLAVCLLFCVFALLCVCSFVCLFRWRRGTWWSDRWTLFAGHEETRCEVVAKTLFSARRWLDVSEHSRNSLPRLQQHVSVRTRRLCSQRWCQRFESRTHGYPQ